MTTAIPPATTLTTARGSPRRTTAGALALSWLFPRPTDPALELDWPPGEERLIGREDGLAMRLADPNASRRHARLSREGDGVFLLDLGSRNGTFVNGRRVQSTRLAMGDIVRIGDSVAVVTDRPGVPVEIAPGLHGGALMAQVLAAAQRAAPSNLPIILEGETGTGKEVVARAIHAWSGRSGDFVAVNCAAMPEGLAEGELFGYRRGAFTGADRASPGVFRSADGGTLLLDEVVDLPLVIQAKLLRALEQQEVQPLGESRPVPVDVRVILAAQSPLRLAVETERFRGDLLARLDGLTVRLPPLRDRVGDVPALFQRLFAVHNEGVGPALEADFVERLCLYDWPFNVREVALLAKRLHVLCDPQASLTASDLPARMLEGSAGQGAPSEASPARDAEAPALPAMLAALRACQGNVTQAAGALGISRQRAYRMLQGHAVDIEEVRRETQERGNS